MELSSRNFIPTPTGVHIRETQGTSVARMKDILYGHRMARSQSLFKRDLRGHFGCVNAIEFSSDGDLIASGGDDRRLLLWNIGRTIFDDKAPHVIDTLHISNINSCCFHADNRKVSTGGNDGQVIVHDINVRQSTSVYGLSDAVYCLSPDPVNATILATATDDGRAQILDLRMSIDTAPFVLADLGSAMHSIMFNPAEPRLLATANSKHGVGLWDIRRPLKCVHYKTNVQNCMSVRFNNRGDQLLALRRRSSPILYDLNKLHPVYEFDHNTYYNACTLKSCSFAGLKDEFVMSGSDDFCIYLWKVPTDISENYIQSEPHMILKGHRSIVNQVRYCPYNQLVISSGVEKLIKMWSPYYIPGCTGRLLHSRRYGDDDEVERNAYSHEEYIHMVLQAGSFLSHDYTNGSTEEEPCMIAFFDSLIQREIEQNVEEEASNSSSSEDEGQVVGRLGPNVGHNSHDDHLPSGPGADGENASNTRDTTASSSNQLEDSTRPFQLDLESSSDSEGEVDVILSAMYSRYMTARERAMSSGLRPSGKKISSVIAMGKRKNGTLQKTQPKKVEGKHKNLQRGGDQFLSENTANINILSEMIDSFVDNLVARESSHTLSDTNDDHTLTGRNGDHTVSDSDDSHLLTDSCSYNTRDNSSTPVEIAQQTITLHVDSPTRRESIQPSRRQSEADHDAPAGLVPGLYFMPELQAFAPESFNVVANLGQSPGLLGSDSLGHIDNIRLVTNLDQSLDLPASDSLCHTDSSSNEQAACRSGSSLHVQHSGITDTNHRSLNCEARVRVSRSSGDFVSSSSFGSTLTVSPPKPASSHRTLLQDAAITDSNHSRSRKNKHKLASPTLSEAPPTRKGNHHYEPFVQRSFQKCNNLSSTSSSCVPTEDLRNYCQSSSSSHATEVLTGVSSDLNNGTQSGAVGHNVDSCTHLPVQFKKVKVKGKIFRRSKSSSDEEK